MTRVRANHEHLAATTDDFATLADPLDARSNLHRKTLSLSSFHPGRRQNSNRPAEYPSARRLAFDQPGAELGYLSETIDGDTRARSKKNQGRSQKRFHDPRPGPFFRRRRSPQKPIVRRRFVAAWPDSRRLGREDRISSTGTTRSSTPISTDFFDRDDRSTSAHAFDTTAAKQRPRSNGSEASAAKQRPLTTNNRAIPNDPPSILL